jgi:hypothetical protein
MEEWKESDICRLLGLSRSELKGYREQAEEGKHWRRKPGNNLKFMWPIMWNAEGVKFIKVKAGIEDSLVEELKDQVSQAREIFGIVKMKFKNNHIILCTIKYDKVNKDVNVLVRDSKNFVVGMKVPLRSNGERYVAAKHPRFGGKW